MAVLETNFSNITCGETNAAGETFFSQCNGLSFAASVAPGETAFLRATLNYHYTDDGLPLPRPQGIQLDTGGRDAGLDGRRLVADEPRASPSACPGCADIQIAVRCLMSRRSRGWCRTAPQA
jgi:hypothetical protein